MFIHSGGLFVWGRLHPGLRGPAVAGLSALILILLLLQSACDGSQSLGRKLSLDFGGQDTITVSPGEYQVPHDLLVPAGKTLILGPDATLNFAQDTSLNVEGKIRILGSQGHEVVLRGYPRHAENYWKGIRIVGATPFDEQKALRETRSALFPEERSPGDEDYDQLIEYCRVQDIRWHTDYIALRANYEAAVSVENSSLRVAHLELGNVVWVNAVQAIHSRLRVQDSDLSSPLIHKNVNLTFSLGQVSNVQINQDMAEHQCNDGIWVISSIAYLHDNFIRGKGDDGVDIKDSFVIATGNTISGNKKDGLKFGHHSRGIAEGNVIFGNLRNGLEVSTESRVRSRGNTVRNNANGLVLKNRAFLISDHDRIHDNEASDLTSTYAFNDEMAVMGEFFKRLGSASTECGKRSSALTKILNRMGEDLEVGKDLESFEAWNEFHECSRLTLAAGTTVKDLGKRISTGGTLCSNVAALNDFKSTLASDFP